MRLMITSKSSTNINKRKNVCWFSRSCPLRDLASQTLRVKPVLGGMERVAEKTQGVLRERRKEGSSRGMEF